MTTLEKIMQMRQAGYADSDIITNLQEQGISPREINESLAQSKIKEAVSNPNNEFDGYSESSSEGMQPSVMNQPYSQEDSQEYNQDNNPNAEYPEPQSQYEGQQYQEEYPQSPNYPQEDYSQAQSYGLNTETITEVAEQIIDEKLAKTNKSLAELNEFKSIIDSKVQKIDERLQRIESIIDQLQTSLIRKSLAQEENIEDIKSELIGMQSNFGKILNPLTDKIREVQSRQSQSKNPNQNSEKNTSSNSFQKSGSKKPQKRSLEDGF